MKILITGSEGFIGKNLKARFQFNSTHEILKFDISDGTEALVHYLDQADFIYHLAGANRPENESEFNKGNFELTEFICGKIREHKKDIPFVLSSSIQALQDNSYGRSKKLAEEAVVAHANYTNSPCIIYRLRNVFGKWGRPDYNSVVATFCYNVAHCKPITISNPEARLELVYIDDVINHFVAEIDKVQCGCIYRDVKPVYSVTLQELANTIISFREMRSTLRIPDLGNIFVKKLYGTYTSYLPTESFSYNLDLKMDDRGFLAEFIKSNNAGQIFISKTKPGITRGDHFHHTKTEKFLVIQGEAVVRFRHIIENYSVEYHVNGNELQVIDIPTGYTHSIKNVGTEELITIFWASEIFNTEEPDTKFLTV
ncbi:MAG TPA: NAD-dependent epimerase/dehydratase family protein [Chitinispirillaceae bacterium]|nr:NAD-dependent epimerase/dehydratase family protein [Chitinispirillaceae bacterium]